MYTGKRVLLIAGGGTLGTYVSKELLRLGAFVEVICPEEKVSDNDRLQYHRSLATEELLTELFSRKHYDGIVNFIHYPDPEAYKKIYPLLIGNTDHLIFLSSYRVYGDLQHPITESAPQLANVATDPYFLENEKYAVPKSKCEDFLRNEHGNDPWTIVRPVISFSDRRLDLLLCSGHKVLQLAKDGRELVLPEMVKDFSAGLDWAYNSGKLIANLLFKPEAIGEAFTIYSGHGLTWGQVAELYEKHIGLKVRWCCEEEYLSIHKAVKENQILNWAWIYDRRFNRDIDCSKVLKVTGLTAADFGSIEEGICCEVQKAKEGNERI